LLKLVSGELHLPIVEMDENAYHTKNGLKTIFLSLAQNNFT
jgi:hypothetical protein